MQLVFQDALDSLDPRRRVAEIVAEPFAIHHVARGGARRARVLELLEAVQSVLEQALHVVGQRVVAVTPHTGNWTTDLFDVKRVE